MEGGSHILLSKLAVPSYILNNWALHHKQWCIFVTPLTKIVFIWVIQRCKVVPCLVIGLYIAPMVFLCLLGYSELNYSWLCKANTLLLYYHSGSLFLSWLALPWWFVVSSTFLMHILTIPIVYFEKMSCHILYLFLNWIFWLLGAGEVRFFFLFNSWLFIELDD